MINNDSEFNKTVKQENIMSISNSLEISKLLDESSDLLKIMNEEQLHQCDLLSKGYSSTHREYNESRQREEKMRTRRREIFNELAELRSR